MAFDQTLMRDALHKLRTTPGELRKTQHQLMRQISGEAAVELANATNPPFIATDGSPLQGFRRRVEKDHARVHPHVSEIYRYVERMVGKSKADQFWAIKQRQSLQDAINWLPTIGVHVQVSQFSAQYVESNRNEKGYVKDSVQPHYIEDSDLSNAKKYKDRKKANVGMTKAGWLAASAQITRSRAGGAKVAWLRKLSRRSAGSGSLVESASGFRGSLKNEIPWSQEALNPRLAFSIPRNIERRFTQSMQKILKYYAKKL